MTLSNHGNITGYYQEGDDCYSQILLRWCDRNTTASERPTLETWELARRNQVYWRAGISRRKELSMRAPSWGTDGAKRAHGVRERRSRAGRLYVVIYWWRFRKWCLASGSRGLGSGPLKVRAQALKPAAVWHAFLLSGSLPCLPCHTDWNLPKVLHNINIFSLPMFLPGIWFIATTQKRLTHVLGPVNSQDL